MSEKPNPDQIRQWHDHALGLVEGGATVEDGRFWLAPGQLDTLKAEMDETLAAAAGQPSAEALVRNGPEQAEVLTPERLREIIDTSYYVACPYVYSQIRIGNLPTRKDDPRILNATAIGLAEMMTSSTPAKGMQRPFTEQGISEVVTIAKASDFAFFNGGRMKEGDTWPQQPYQKDPVYVVQYMTLTAPYEDRIPDESQPSGFRKGNRFPYGDQSGRQTSLGYTMLLPESLAKELGTAMQADPELARRLADELVLNEKAHRISGVTVARPGVDKSTWDERKPHYNEWEQANGASKMAFRTASSQTVDESTVVTFHPAA